MYRYFELILAMGTAWALSGILRLSLPANRKVSAAPYAVIVIVVFLLGIFDNLLRPHLLPINVLHFIYPVTRLSYFLVGPALWFYAQALLKENFKIKWKSCLHLIPFIIWFIYVLFDPASLHPKIPFGETAAVSMSRDVVPVLSLSFLWDLSVNLSRLIYSAALLVLLKRHSDTLPDRFSSINSWTTLSWLKNLIVFYTGIYLLNSLVQMIFPAESELVQISAAIGRSLPAVLFVFLFSLYSENQPVLVEEEASPGDENKGGGKKSQNSYSKYEKSGMGTEESKAVYSKLFMHVKKTKVYLDPELTLDMLSGQLGESRHRLSEVINRESGKRFFSFINDFRLKEFRDAVASNRYPEFTIIAVAFECGFRSSSAFYSLVKKEFGMTPKEFVRKIKIN